MSYICYSHGTLFQRKKDLSLCLLCFPCIITGTFSLRQPAWWRDCIDNGGEFFSPFVHVQKSDIFTLLDIDEVFIVSFHHIRGTIKFKFKL
uniref:Uncharacterized protein n=1 Tax=Rhizophora mucronata TaxID=61149 RepID=A0A2P2K9K4_RHIMU